MRELGIAVLALVGELDPQIEQCCPASRGFISLFGVSTMDGILLVFYIRRNLDEGHDKEESITGGAQVAGDAGNPQAGTGGIRAFPDLARRIAAKSLAPSYRRLAQAG